MKKAFLVQLLSVTLVFGLISVHITPENVNAEITTPQAIVTADQTPEDTRHLSMGPAPDAGQAPTVGASGEDLFKGIHSGVAAFAMEVSPGESLVHLPDTTLPGTWNVIASLSGTNLFAGDFVGGDFETLYTVDYSTNALISVDTSTGAKTAVGITTPPTGHYFTGLSGTPDGTMFGLTSNCGGGTNLVRVDITSGLTANLGALPGIDCGIDLAYNTEDGMIYIVDISTDKLFKVDPDTLIVTLVGNTGVSANYAQDIEFEEESGVLYWAAYTTSGELRILDTTTGLSTLVGAFPGGAQVDCLAFPTGGIPDDVKLYLPIILN